MRTLNSLCVSPRVIADIQATPFTSELARLSIHDLTAPYQALARALRPLSTSLPITLLNLSAIFALLTDYYAGLKDGEDHLNSGLESALSLQLALYATCLGEAAPHLPQTAHDLIRVGALRALEPKLIEKSYSSLSEILRLLAPTILKADQSAQETLRSTWQRVTPYLRPRENKRYVRKCVADAWIGVIRKARGEGLERLMAVLLDGQAPGMEAVWSGSMKGTSGQLHSRALPIFEIILRHALEAEDESAVETLKTVVISIAHHSTSGALTPIAEAVTTALRSAVADANWSSTRTTRLLELLGVLLYHRKGRRFPEGSLKPTMQLLVELATVLGSPQTEKRTRESYLQAVIGALMAGKLEHWLSPGVSLIERVVKSAVS